MGIAMPNAAGRVKRKSFDGAWDDGEGTVVTIEGSDIKGPDGITVRLALLSDGSCTYTLGQETLVGKLSASGAKLDWNDGGTWTRTGVSTSAAQTVPQASAAPKAIPPVATPPLAPQRSSDTAVPVDNWAKLTVFNTFAEALEVDWPGIKGASRPPGATHSVEWQPVADFEDAEAEDEGAEGEEPWDDVELKQLRTLIHGIPEGTLIRLRVVERGEDNRRLATGPWVEAKTLEVNDELQGLEEDPMGACRGDCEASSCWRYVSYGSQQPAVAASLRSRCFRCGEHFLLHNLPEVEPQAPEAVSSSLREEAKAPARNAAGAPKELPATLAGAPGPREWLIEPPPRHSPAALNAAIEENLSLGKWDLREDASKVAERRRVVPGSLRFPSSPKEKKEQGKEEAEMIEVVVRSLHTGSQHEVWIPAHGTMADVKAALAFEVGRPEVKEGTMLRKSIDHAGYQSLPDDMLLVPAERKQLLAIMHADLSPVEGSPADPLLRRERALAKANAKAAESRGSPSDPKAIHPDEPEMVLVTVTHATDSINTPVDIIVFETVDMKGAKEALEKKLGKQLKGKLAERKGAVSFTVLHDSEQLGSRRDLVFSGASFR